MLVKGYEVKVKEEGRDILSELDGLIGKLNGVLDRAEAKEQDGKLLRAARELKGFYELLSKLQFALYQQKQMEVEESNDYLTIEFQENWDTLVESEEKEVWESVMVKAIGGHRNRLPRIKYRDGNDAPIHEFSGIIGRQDSGSADADQEEPDSEEIGGYTAHIEAQEKNEDIGQNDLRVRPIPIITPYDPIQTKFKKRLP